MFSRPFFLTSSTPDRHDPALRSGLHLLPVDLCSPLLGPTEPLQPEDEETRGYFGGIQVRGPGEGILPGAGAGGAGLLLSARVSGESSSACARMCVRARLCACACVVVADGGRFNCQKTLAVEYFASHVASLNFGALICKLILIRMPPFHSLWRCVKVR